MFSQSSCDVERYLLEDFALAVTWLSANTSFVCDVDNITVLSAADFTDVCPAEEGSNWEELDWYLCFS
jgi:hypothetical protein